MRLRILGAKKMLIDKTIDVYARSENVLLPVGEEMLFDISAPVFTENVHMGQFIAQPTPGNVDALGFFHHSQTIVCLMFAGFLVTSLFVYLFRWIVGRLSQRDVQIRRNRHQPSTLKRLFHHLSRLKNFYSYPLGSRILTKINLIVLFYLLFIQILLNMVSSNIKTNEVVVDVK